MTSRESREPGVEDVVGHHGGEARLVAATVIASTPPWLEPNTTTCSLTSRSAHAMASLALVTSVPKVSGRRTRGLLPWPWPCTPTTVKPASARPSQNSSYSSGWVMVPGRNTTAGEPGSARHTDSTTGAPSEVITSAS